MIGYKVREFRPLTKVSLEYLVPKDHFYHQVDLSTLGDPLHDDLLMSAALCAVLDEQEWFISGAPMLLRRRDPLAELDNKGW